MAGDKKGLAAMIVSKMPAKGAPGDEPNADDASYDGKAACAEDMMKAMQENDAKAFMTALDAYLDHR